MLIYPTEFHVLSLPNHFTLQTIGFFTGIPLHIHHLSSLVFQLEHCFLMTKTTLNVINVITVEGQE